MNRARIKNIIKLHFSITRAIVNHFQKQTHHEAQHGEIFLKHISIWWNHEIEFLLVLKSRWDSMVVWMFKLETGAHTASTRWMVKILGPETTWNSFTRPLPWMMLGKNSPTKAFYSWRMIVEMGLKWCLDDGTTKVWSWPLGVSCRFLKCQENEF